MSKGMHSLCVPKVRIAGTMSYVPLLPGIQHKSQLKVVNQINFTWWMNEWSFQAGPIANIPWSFLLPFRSPSASLPPTWTTLSAPLTALIQGPSSHSPSLTYPILSRLPQHLPSAKQLSFRVGILSSCSLSFQMSPSEINDNAIFWGKRAGLINLWNYLQWLAP